MPPILGDIWKYTALPKGSLKQNNGEKKMKLGNFWFWDDSSSRFRVTNVLKWFSSYIYFQKRKKRWWRQKTGDRRTKDKVFTWSQPVCHLIVLTCSTRPGVYNIHLILMPSAPQKTFSMAALSYQCYTQKRSYSHATLHLIVFAQCFVLWFWWGHLR